LSVISPFSAAPRLSVISPFSTPPPALTLSKGSTTTFEALNSQIAEARGHRSFARVVGETGGKNFQFVDGSADLEHAVFSVVRGAFEYNGQKVG
jgi:acyl-CoA reductase-like NAD-dependent aldehyde dehydrogenase